MVNPSKVLKARGSKRQSLKDKHKIAKKIREHHRKVRKDKRLNPQKYKKRDPGIPNSWPFKAQLLMQQQQAREDEKERMIAQREANVRERQLRRRSVHRIGDDLRGLFPACRTQVELLLFRFGEKLPVLHRRIERPA